MHGDVGIGVDELKELDPDPSKHDGIHVGNIMKQAQSHIHYAFVTPLPVMSNHIISSFQQGRQAFPFVKVKTAIGNTYGHTYLFCQLYNSHHLIMGRN
jgi:hypothetical protein